MGKAVKKSEIILSEEVYFYEISKKLRSGKTTEHSFRGAIQDLVESYDNKINAINEPKRIKCGAPDFILLKKNIPIGYIESKDIDINLKKIENSEQLKRYRDSLSNLVLTNQLDFIWFVDGEKRTEISIGKLSRDKKEIKLDDDYDKKLNLFFESVLTEVTPTITTSQDLAVRLANRTRSIREIIISAFKYDESRWLKSWLSAFQDVLFKDLDEELFADMFAQTLSYGFFAARFYQNEEINFSRFSAGKILPKTNPFLRKLFSQFAGSEMPETIDWAIDEIVGILKRTDIDKIREEFSNSSLSKSDPIIYFYETFLEAYNPKLRETRGVYYTPDPIVDFMTRSVDQILKKDFAKKGGITNDEVTILDPATGTGSFLKKCIDLIHSSFEGDEGAWNHYIEDVLLERIFGLELLMAPYSIAHMKLGLQLQESGYKFKKDQRLGVFLTNTLEKSARITDDMMFDWVSDEVNAASEVKNEKPIMVVMGNPPYANDSENKGEWISGLMKGFDSISQETTENYFECEGKPLGERNSKNINDDYVKFMRFAQWRINKTGHGVLAYITNHGFLDNPTFRGMRESLLNEFDDLYVLDLHGNVKKREITPDGGKDENVFDIQQGVSISFFIKHLEPRKEKNVYKADLYGTRKYKYDQLLTKDINNISWEKIKPTAPFYIFSKQFDVNKEKSYNSFLSLKDIFSLSFNGIKTHRDHFAIANSKEEMENRISDLRGKKLSKNEIKEKYNLKETSSFDIEETRESIRNDKHWKSKLVKCDYRPFLTKYCYLDRMVMDRPRKEVVHHILNKENYSILTTRQLSIEGFNHCFGVRNIAETCTVSSKTKEATYVFPLFQYGEDLPLLSKEDQRTFNINGKILEQLNLSTNQTNYFKVFYYVFAILNSSEYRKQFKSFLKIDFPRIPITNNIKKFNEISKVGKVIFENQIDESLHSNKNIKSPSQSEGRVIEKTRYVTEGKKLFLNDSFYFENIDSSIYSYCIGNHQVLKKLIDDYRGCEINYDLIKLFKSVYSKIEKNLSLLIKLDKVILDLGGLDEIVKSNIEIIEEEEAKDTKVEDSKKAISKKDRKHTDNTQEIFVPKTPFDKVLEKRLALISKVIETLPNDSKLNRVKIAKAVYLCDVCTDVDLKTKYVREAAGPLDQRFFYNDKIGVDKLGQELGLFTIQHKKLKSGEQFRYKAGKNSELMSKKVDVLFGKQAKTINRVLELMSEMNYEQSEIFATLYACWNDLLLSKKKVTDKVTVKEFLEKWHPDKKQYSETRLLSALKWMKQKKFVPKGTPPKVTTKRFKEDIPF